MLILLHSGQTGVERGAHRAAVAAGIEVAGFMSIDRRDELGAIPVDIARFLTPCFDRGPRPAVRANVELASGVAIVVPDRRRVDKVTAMNAVIGAVRRANVPWIACDLTSDTAAIARFAQGLQATSGSVRLLVTGPRGTRWIEGESVAHRLVASLGLHDSSTSAA
jgi:hypothetical protein